MRKLSSALLIIAVILSMIVGGLIFLYTDESGPLQSTLNAKVLVLCADPTEDRPGIGGVDMAFVVDLQDGNVKNITPIYPGGMHHPTASPPAEVGTSALMLHDTLWNADTEQGAKLAQETVEANKGIKTDVVVIVTPAAIDALIRSVGGVWVEGRGLVQGDTLQFLREGQNSAGLSRGNAVEGLASAIKKTAMDPSKKPAIMNTMIAQYNAGNIVVVPNDFAYKFMTAEGMNSVLG